MAANIKWGCSSVGRAPALQAGGHEFESHHLHEVMKRVSLLTTELSECACTSELKGVGKRRYSKNTVMSETKCSESDYE